jgi:hypothetical protein
MLLLGFPMLIEAVPIPSEVPSSSICLDEKYATILINNCDLFFEIPAILAILEISLELVLKTVDPFPKSVTLILELLENNLLR